uniref:Uncharacterized protein n=2 Tax=Daucus carota subsp. sativus TaxID=79200 RepID=A0A175YHK4_DAUCS
MMIPVRSCLLRKIRAALVICMIVLGVMAPEGDSMKVKSMEFFGSIQSELPRGPVPPSDPSPCHNRVKLMHEGSMESYGQAHFIMCP